MYKFAILNGLICFSNNVIKGVIYLYMHIEIIVFILNKRIVPIAVIRDFYRIYLKKDIYMLLPPDSLF